MLCPVCGSELRPNKGWAGRFYDGYCNTCDMPVVDGVEEFPAKEISCDPDVCPHCYYACEGDSYCEILEEFVMCDWEKTPFAMGKGCPFVKKGRRRRK